MQRFAIETPPRPTSGVTVTVYDACSQNLSAIYTDVSGTTPMSNPFVVPPNGEWEFYAHGNYDVAFGGTASTPDSAYNGGSAFVCEGVQLADILAINLELGGVLPSEAEFEALAAKRRDDCAGSGFVEWGLNTATASSIIGQGLWVPPVAWNQPNVIRMGRDNVAESSGVSKTKFPVANVNGYRLHIKNYEGGLAWEDVFIHLPPAPSTASLLDRQDLVFLETWHEDISEKNIVYPYGNSQGSLTSYTCPDGTELTCVAGSFTGADTYSLHGNWQSSGDLIGKGIVWSTMTEAQKKSFAADPENNLYYTPDNTIVQVRYRIRVVEGLGSDWVNPSKTQGDSTVAYGNFVYNNLNGQYVKPKGSLAIITADIAAHTAGESGYYGTYKSNALAGIMTEPGAWGAIDITDTSIDTVIAYNGLCFALGIALVQRRNQGAFHNVVNPNGTRKFRNFLNNANLDWYSDLYATSVEDCFDIQSSVAGKPQQVTGYIGTTSGRPDGLFYDAIYEHDVTDLRNSAHREEDFKRLIEREFNKLVAGEMRGWENGKELNVTYPSSGGGSAYFYTGGPTLTVYTATNPGTYDYTNVNYGDVFALTDGSGNIIVGQYMGGTKVATDLQLQLMYNSGMPATGAVVQNGSYAFIYPVAKSFSSKTLLHCDILGDPANYYRGHYDFLSSDGVQTVEIGEVVKVVSGYQGIDSNGVVGHFYMRPSSQFVGDLGTGTDYSLWTDLGTDREDSWITNGVMGTPLLVDEDGNSLIPVVGDQTFKMSRKVKDFKLALVSTDNGSSWAVGTASIWDDIEGTTNSVTANVGVGAIVLVFYTTEASPMELANNAEVLALGDAWASSYKALGVGIVTALIGKVPVSPWAPVQSTVIGYANDISGDGSFWYGDPIRHNDFIHSLANSNPCVKTLPYLTRENGKAYLQLLFKEMIYDVDWGDDNLFNVIDGVSTTTDDNGNTVLIGQKRIELPYFIGGGE